MSINKVITVFLSTSVLITCCFQNLGATVIKNIYPEYLEDARLDRIYDYFSDKETIGPWAICRTHSDVKEGLYFIIILDHSINMLPKQTVIKINIISTENSEPITYNLTLQNISLKSKEIYAGLTGTDWPDENKNLLAWKVALISEDKIVLAERKSYLW